MSISKYKRLTPPHLQREFISHARKVCSLYKKAARDIEAWENDFFEVRFQKLQLRKRFDDNKSIKDPRVAKRLLLQGEEEHESICHDQPPIKPYAKDGIAYGRNLESPDAVMDAYHPLEKARYPYYFAKREQLKDEYIRLWQKKYKVPIPKSNFGNPILPEEPAKSPMISDEKSKTH